MAGQPRKPGEYEHATTCGRCGGVCCQRAPVVTDDELDLMNGVFGFAKVEGHLPKLGLETGTWSFLAGCPALTSRGCILLYDQRPEACRLYPFVRQPDGLLLLDLRCPSWKTFGEDLRRS